MRVGVMVSFATALAAATALPAAAQPGPGVGSTVVTLPQPALPDHVYAMTPVYVVNTGSASGRFHLSVERLTEGPERLAPPQWFAPDENDFLLDPQQSKYVGVTLRLPADAAPGAYLTHIVLTAGAPTAIGAGATAGTAAATKISFTVAEAPLTTWQTLLQTFGSWGPVAGGVIGAMVFALLASLRIQRRR